MIFCRTPFRISLFGGGTDFKEYYSKKGAYLIGGSINKYSYFFVNHKSIINQNCKFKINYSTSEAVNYINEIKHRPFRELLKNFHNDSPIELTFLADLPGRSGMGSSSSFSAGAIHILSKIGKKKISSRKIAKDSIYFERYILKEPGGIQDQIMCTHGGFNLLNIDKKGFYKLYKFDLGTKFMKKLQSNLLLFYIGNKRFSSDLEKKKISKLNRNLEYFHKIKSISLEAYQLIKSQDIKLIDNIGLLLDKSWQFKKKLEENVTNNLINKHYDIAKKNGALGGKLLGAGAGGFLLFYVPKSKQIKLRSKLKLKEIDFSFEDTGSSIIEI